jgi:hypothetical protein
MTKPDQSKAVAIPALLVFGKPTSPDLPQASWFRIEARASITAAAQTLKFSVIDIQTEAERALTVGVHEGVLKGSGRMVVDSVSAEVYRRIEDYVGKASGADHRSKIESTAPVAAESASEQNQNKLVANTGATSGASSEMAGPASTGATSSPTGTAASIVADAKKPRASIPAASSDNADPYTLHACIAIIYFLTNKYNCGMVILRGDP